MSTPATSIPIPMAPPDIASFTSSAPPMGDSFNNNNNNTYSYNEPDYRVNINDSLNNDNNNNNVNNNVNSSSTNDNHLVDILNRVYQTSALNERMIQELGQKGYTRGLMDALIETKKSFPLRIWVVDNSGSMKTTDGTRLIEKNDKTMQVVTLCTRWEEMYQTIEYHARLAACIEAPTVFRLLNDPGIIAGKQEVSIAVNGLDRITIEQDLNETITTFSKTTPGGVTPLVDHINAIRQTVVSVESLLRSSGTKISIIIATDGLPSDYQGVSNDGVKRDFEQALRSLEGLPVWLTVRLFTSETDVVEFWNEIDARLELSIEVIDDYISESVEMYDTNKWLNYGLPLHRLREFGYSNYLFDIIDEKKLSKNEIRSFCRILFGTGGLLDEAPDAGIDWNGFVKILDKVNTDTTTSTTTSNTSGLQQWNPITKRLGPWIDMRKLKTEYSTTAGQSGSCGCTIM